MSNKCVYIFFVREKMTPEEKEQYLKKKREENKEKMKQMQRERNMVDLIFIRMFY